MKKPYFFFLFLLIGINLSAAFENPIFMLIDNPTCGNYFRGQYEVRVRIEPEGGILTGIYIGITDNFSIGVSYGGDHVVGYGAIEGYKYPGVEVRYRAIEETLIYPAFALGFSSQGYGPQINGRYRIKSKGFYGVVSKNFEFIGNLSIHGGINYSLEHSDGNKNLNVFLGFEKTITTVYSFLADYDFAFNEGIKEYRKDGYLNIGIKGYFAPNIAIEFDIRNMLRTGDDGINRVLKLSYLESF
ncbi:MAG: hypothetical protein E3J41_03470 [Candidatus Cloacimonadota bacterium]|nr:MAG: hypothetical protein E3J41_03470 [Candidatus Cloacimonadota bacterium]